MITHSFEYSRSLANIGEVDFRPHTTVPVLIRRIPNTNLFDGILPWPYIEFSDICEIEGLIKAYPELVTITGNIAPTSSIKLDTRSRHYVFPHKPHFVYDPHLPFQVSARTRRHINNGSRLNCLTIPPPKKHGDLTQEILFLYDQFSNRKKLAESCFRFGGRHYEFFQNDATARIFIARDERLNLSAIALGFLSGTNLYLAHIIIGDDGLINDAGYALMNSVISFATENDLRVYFGGLPSQNQGGLYLFKKRWSNLLVESRFLKVVIQPEKYRELAYGKSASSYFPLYRN